MQEAPRDPRKTPSTDRALEHFDDFYKSVFGPKWPGIRASLLSENKFAAIVNNYGDAEVTKQNLELSGAVNIRKVFELFYDEEGAAQAAVSGDKTQTAKSSVDRKLEKLVIEKKKSDFKSIYQDHVDVELEKMALEEEVGPSRTIEPENVVDYKKSLQKSLAEDSEYDFNRMISAEVGTMGLQEFIPATKLKGMEDYIVESEHYQYYNTGVEFPLKFDVEHSFEIPESLDIYMFPKGDISRFSRPIPSSTKMLSHFLLDAASILPPLMLNVQPNEIVLDACAAPGGKSLILLQSLLPETLVCNDSSLSRIHRTYDFFYQYLPEFQKNWEGERCIVQSKDVRLINEFSKYDKVSEVFAFPIFLKLDDRCDSFAISQILVDVPCSNDRLSVMESTNSMFRPDRIRERLQLPELQAQLLVQCLQLLKPGGSLVYSTCSLSPIQNDGVVNMALTKAFTDFHITATIKYVQISTKHSLKINNYFFLFLICRDLTHVLKPFKKLFYFEEPKNLKFGQLVLPQLPANAGPMYFCKIQRNEN